MLLVCAAPLLSVDFAAKELPDVSLEFSGRSLGSVVFVHEAFSVKQKLPKVPANRSELSVFVELQTHRDTPPIRRTPQQQTRVDQCDVVFARSALLHAHTSSECILQYWKTGCESAPFALVSWKMGKFTPIASYFAAMSEASISSCLLNCRVGKPKIW